MGNSGFTGRALPESLPRIEHITRPGRLEYFRELGTANLGEPLRNLPGLQWSDCSY
jgi:hypothetical protein